MDYDDDKDQTLHELSLRHGASIVSQLVDIGNQGNQLRHIKYRSFVSRLQCLQLGGIKLRRTFINAFRKQEYVALSYTWTPSEYEDPEAGRYRVEVWDGNHLEPSIVRNCVFDRILGYMRYTNVQLLWIDAHCIPRDASDDPASTCHTRCTQKRDAIQAMDLVYQLSKHPVALLGRPLRVESELHLLERILLGDFVDDSMRRLLRATTIYEARKALWLLCEITRDSWWGRDWTFQENYRGGQRMKLLIRHDPSLEQQKLRLKVFGKMPEGYATFTEMYLHRMAIELAAAVRARRKLRLGSIWDPKRRSSPYRAIFVWSSTEEDGDELCPPPAFVFTSARSRDPGSEAHEANDIDRHVSLEVDLEEPLDCDGMPHLRIRTWRLGICFFEGCPRTKVVFPWPRALRAIKPL
ncbi:hypothetical protein ACO1O0_008295 [Amphichorda felina]